MSRPARRSPRPSRSCTSAPTGAADTAASTKPLVWLSEKCQSGRSGKYGLPRPSVEISGSSGAPFQTSSAYLSSE